MHMIRPFMTQRPVTTKPGSKVWEAANTMLSGGYSGLPVVDELDDVVGVISESDFLRRGELQHGEPHRFWQTLFMSRGALAEEYSKSFGKNVSEVMTSPALTIDVHTSIDEAAAVMAEHNIKRLPVMEDEALVGIITRSDIMRALIKDMASTTVGRLDADIRSALEGELHRQLWGDTIKITVDQAVVLLEGSVLDPREKTAARIAAENTSGVVKVIDEIKVIGMADRGSMSVESFP